ncbi:MAG: 8-amino-7-oxononanoate synthase [Phycisphaerae bacterium]
MPRIPIAANTASTVTINGRDLVAFGGCNYLGLGHHPDVKASVVRAMDYLGLTTSASRETSGNTLEHELLEAELAQFLGMEASILMPEGYTANLALAQALAAPEAWPAGGGDPPVAVIDEKSHRSIRNAVEASGFEVADFEHLSAADAMRVIRRHTDRRVCVWTDGVFAADGAIAPLPGLLAAMPRNNALLVVDDCHGFCVLGTRGRGTCEHFGISDPRILWTSTLAKGLGCYGGAVASSRRLIGVVRDHAGIYKGTTPVPPILAHAAREALRVIDREADLVSRLEANVRRIRRSLAAMGLPVEDSPSPVMTFVLDSAQRMRSFYDRLIAQDVFIPLIDYPNGPAPLYFRLSVCAMHSPGQIDHLLRSLETALADTASLACQARAAG